MATIPQLRIMLLMSMGEERGKTTDSNDIHHATAKALLRNGFVLGAVEYGDPRGPMKLTSAGRRELVEGLRELLYAELNEVIYGIHGTRAYLRDVQAFLDRGNLTGHDFDLNMDKALEACQAENNKRRERAFGFLFKRDKKQEETT